MMTDAALITPVTPAPHERLSGAIAAVADRVRQSVVLIYHRGGNGAGVIWRDDGEIITNAHVAQDDRLEVVLADGGRHVGIVAARHPTRDIAVVKIVASGLPAITVGDSTRIRPGQLAIAVGHPYGYRDAVTFGVIAAAGQAATVEGPQTGDHIQADLLIAPGSSGGPLVDARGHVIGINTMVRGRLALAIPSHAVERFVQGGRPTHGASYLGIVGDVVSLHRDDFPTGLVVTGVETGSPADRAGLIVGDVITAIGPEAIIDRESAPVALMRLVPGEPVEIHLLRGGDPRLFTVVPTERA